MTTYIPDAADGPFARMATLGLSDWRLILRTTSLVLLLAIVFLAVSPTQYVATLAFTPSTQPRTQMGAVAGLASQIGLTLEGAGSDPLAFYVTLSQSREILLRVADRRFVVPSSRDTASYALSDLLIPGGVGRRDGLNEAVARLREIISPRAHAQAGIVEVRIAAADPAIAEQIGAGLLEEIHRFNLDRRRSQASAERQFIESRTEITSAELARAEGDLAGFLAANRQYANSAELTLEYERLRRRVDLQQSLLISLAQSLEQARIEEVRNTPLITVVDAPEGSALRKSKRVFTTVGLALFFGAAMGFLLALGRASLLPGSRALQTTDRSERLNVALESQFARAPDLHRSSRTV